VQLFVSLRAVRLVTVVLYAKHSSCEIVQSKGSEEVSKEIGHLK
jgi:hypothetical protein